MIVTERKQRDGGISFGYECGNSFPHLFITSLESENIHVPVRGLLHIAHGERHVINSFEFHHTIYTFLWRRSMRIILDGRSASHFAMHREMRRKLNGFCCQLRVRWTWRVPIFNGNRPACK